MAQLNISIADTIQNSRRTLRIRHHGKLRHFRYFRLDVLKVSLTVERQAKWLFILATWLIITAHLSFAQAESPTNQNPIKGGKACLIYKSQGFHNDSQALLVEIKSYSGTDLAKTFITASGQTLSLYPRNSPCIIPYPISPNRDSQPVNELIDKAIKRFPQFSKKLLSIKTLWMQCQIESEKAKLTDTATHEKMMPEAAESSTRISQSAKIQITLQNGDKHDISVAGSGKDATFREFYCLDGTVYKDASVSSISDDSLGIRHDTGAARIPWEAIPENVGEIIGVDVPTLVAKKASRNEEKVKEKAKETQKQQKEFEEFANTPPPTDKDGTPIFVKRYLKELGLSVSVIVPDTIEIYQVDKLTRSGYSWSSLVDWGAQTVNGEHIRGRAIFTLEKDGKVTSFPLPR